MATSFPTALDVLADPNATTGTADAGFFHDVMHSNANDAISAIQAKVGITNSPVSSSLDYIIHHHQHLGTDGSSSFSNLIAKPVVDGPVITAQTAGGTTIMAVQSATSSAPTVKINPVGGTVVGLAVQAAILSPAADLFQGLNLSGQALAGIQGSGQIYGTQGITLSKGYGGVAYLVSQPTNGEVDYVNGGLIRGYSGAYTGAGGTGEQFHLDGAAGFLKLGGTSGQAQIVLNAWNVLRSCQMLYQAKDNADSGLTQFVQATDADGQLLTARSHFIQGNLGKTATGALIGADTFLSMSYPTYDGNVTYTKAIGLSAMPAVTPTLTAGTVSVAGAVSISGNTTVGGSLAVTGALSTSAHFFPGAEAGGSQSSGGIIHSTGIPSSANGTNNDWCISDNGHFYFKSAGAWLQKI